MSSAFISDLHLDPGHPAPIRNFLDLLATGLRNTDALYILGDLFEIWIGDDHIDSGYQPVIAALRQTTDQGLPVYLLHGNRDFLVGPDFLEITGCQLLADPELIDLYGQRTLLMHGDLLCTDDSDYQAFRQTVRNPSWQAQVLEKSVHERLAMARDVRLLSSELTDDKPDAIMDVNQAAVHAMIEQYDADLLIHGHTHRPGIHPFSVNQRPVQRAVLADWHEQGNLLRVTGEKLVLEYF